MQSSKTVSATLPPAILSRAIRMARAEKCSMADLIRAALQSYDAEHRWARIRDLGDLSAAKYRLKESDVVGLVKSVRRKMRDKKPAASQTKKK